jgi:hypothetical protein
MFFANINYMKKSSNRGFSPLIIILAIAAILAVGYKLYSNKNQSEQAATNQANTNTNVVTSGSSTNSAGQVTTSTQPAQGKNPASTISMATYKNDKYGFEIQYPSSWAKPRESTPREIGPKYELKISFRNDFAGNTSAKGFDVKIYKTQLNVNRVETQTDDLSPNASWTKDKNYSSECGVFATTSVKEVYAVAGDKCFKEAYFFTFFKNNRIYNIVPIPKDGIGYAGYDGAAKAKVDLPELGKIVGSFGFFK